jgi:hypothetical protein
VAAFVDGARRDEFDHLLDQITTTRQQDRFESDTSAGTCELVTGSVAGSAPMPA